MPAATANSNSSWFRGMLGRRYGRDIALIVAAKLILLILLYWFFIAPQPRADTSPAALREHVLDAATVNPAGDPR